MSARVIVLAGPSGAGKTRLAGRLGLPVLRLDDYYRDHDDPDLPRLPDGLIDWDDVRSWCHQDALAALECACRLGECEVPDYDISQSRRIGTHIFDLGGASYVVAEGIFAPWIVGDLQRAGLLAAAICVTQHPMVTFVRRLLRDLREHRKPPGVLLRRGLRLMREHRGVVRAAIQKGCRPMSPEEAEAHLRALIQP